MNKQCIRTQVPQIQDPCPTLPHFELGQKLAHCELCNKSVHNLSAMTACERQAVLSQPKSCVRYAMALPAALMLSQAAIAQDVVLEEALETVLVTGGGRGPQLESVFLQTENFDEALDEAKPE
jgi:hypothetical protein